MLEGKTIRFLYTAGHQINELYISLLEDIVSKVSEKVGFPYIFKTKFVTEISTLMSESDIVVLDINDFSTREAFEDYHILSRALMDEVPVLGVVHGTANEKLKIPQVEITNGKSQIQLKRLEKEVLKAYRIQENYSKRLKNVSVLIELAKLFNNSTLPYDCLDPEFYLMMVKEKAKLLLPHDMEFQPLTVKAFEKSRYDGILLGKLKCKTKQEGNVETLEVILKYSRNKDDLRKASAIVMSGIPEINVVGCGGYTEGEDYGIFLIANKPENRLDYRYTLLQSLLREAESENTLNIPEDRNVKPADNIIPENTPSINEVNSRFKEIIKATIDTAAKNGIFRYMATADIFQKYQSLVEKTFTDSEVKEIYEAIIIEKSFRSLTSDYYRCGDKNFKPKTPELLKVQEKVNERLNFHKNSFKRQITRTTAWLLKDELDKTSLEELAKQGKSGYDNNFYVQFSEENDEMIDFFARPFANTRFLLPQHADFAPYNLRVENHLSDIPDTIQEFDLMHSRADTCHLDLLSFLCNYHVNLESKELWKYIEYYYERIISAINYAFEGKQLPTKGDTTTFASLNKDRTMLYDKFGIYKTKLEERQLQDKTDNKILDLFKRENYHARIDIRIAEIGKVSNTRVGRKFEKDPIIFPVQITQDILDSEENLSPSAFNLESHVENYEKHIEQLNDEEACDTLVESIYSSHMDCLTGIGTYIFQIQNLKEEISYALASKKNNKFSIKSEDKKYYEELEKFLSSVRVSIASQEFELNFLEGKFYKIISEGDKKQFNVKYDFIEVYCPLEKILKDV